MSDDLFSFKDEETQSGKMGMEPWPVLVVDDDQDVHDATIFALKDANLLGRPLVLYHCYSGVDAIKTLRNHPEIVVILLDAVMETDDAGLQTVMRIRDELSMNAVRIILRTGQPGQIPEIDTITRYDINDYKTKSELTRTRLMTAMIAAIRSWQQIHRLENSRRGLEKIVEASNQFIAQQGLAHFAEGVITQMAGLLNLEPDGVVCAVSPENNCDQGQCYIIAAAGMYKNLMNCRVQELKNRNISEALSISLHQRTTLLEEDSLTVYFEEPGSKKRFAIWIASSKPISEIDNHLLEVFCSNLSLSAANIELVNRLKQQAWEDPLLKIPNLSAFLERLNGTSVHADERYNRLILLDINGFGQLNEMLGHHYADKILLSLKSRIQSLYQDRIYLARVASNTFALLVQKKDFPLEEIAGMNSMVVDTTMGMTELSLSIGVCNLEKDCEDRTGFLHDGFIALKRAKHKGRGQMVVYSTEIGEEARDRLILLQMLKYASEKNQLSLEFQPQICLEDGNTFCLEALMRWSSEGEMIPPERFIPLAEQSGMIVPMGIWVLRRALRALKKIHQAGFPEMRMAVNISAIQLEHRNFLGDLDQILEELEVHPRFLELEITESVSVMGLDHVIPLLNQIRSRGISLAVDDFGTGYSSLSTIEKWPVDRIKIDRSFISQMEQKDEGHSLVELLVPLCRNLSVKILAEGVEKEGQLERLRHIGCDEVQGFYYSTSLELEPLLSWLKENET